MKKKWNWEIKLPIFLNTATVFLNAKKSKVFLLYGQGGVRRLIWFTNSWFSLFFNVFFHTMFDPKKIGGKLTVKG